MSAHSESETPYRPTAPSDAMSHWPLARWANRASQERRLGGGLDSSMCSQCHAIAPWPSGQGHERLLACGRARVRVSVALGQVCPVIVRSVKRRLPLCRRWCVRVVTEALLKGLTKSSLTSWFKFVVLSLPDCSGYLRPSSGPQQS